MKKILAMAALFLFVGCAGNTDQLKKDLEACNSARAQMSDELAAAQAALAAEQEKGERYRVLLERRIALDKDLRARLKKLTDAGKLTIKYRRGLMVLELPNSILYASGKAELSADGKATIKEIADVLATIDDRRLLVSGHTDSRPVSSALQKKFASNWELSFARARSVQQVLLDNGVKPANSGAAGFASHDPIATGEGEDVMKQNRRTEIVLVPNLQDVLGVKETTTVVEDTEPEA